jgi:hypothetical protein
MWRQKVCPKRSWLSTKREGPSLSILRSLTGLPVLDRRKQITVLAAMNLENGYRKFSLNAGNTARMHVAVML